MTPPQRNPFVRFYHALAPMGRWPRWLLIAILLFSFLAMLALIGYTVIVQPSGKALDSAIDNFLALWAVVAIPCAILMLALLLMRMRLRQGWIFYLIGVGAIGIFAVVLWGLLSLNTILTLPHSPNAWLGLLLATFFDTVALGLILLTLKSRWRTWTARLFLAFMITSALTWSYQALANAEPHVAVPFATQVTNAFQSVSYPLGMLLVIAVSIQGLRARSSRVQPPPAS